jgi:YHS domain-containing protein
MLTWPLKRADELQSMSLATDPVYGMRLSKADKTLRHDYRGHLYHFCSKECRARIHGGGSRRFVWFEVILAAKRRQQMRAPMCPFARPRTQRSHGAFGDSQGEKTRSAHTTLLGTRCARNFGGGLMSVNLDAVT